MRRPNGPEDHAVSPSIVMIERETGDTNSLTVYRLGKAKALGRATHWKKECERLDEALFFATKVLYRSFADERAAMDQATYAATRLFVSIGMERGDPYQIPYHAVARGRKVMRTLNPSEALSEEDRIRGPQPNEDEEEE